MNSIRREVFSKMPIWQPRIVKLQRKLQYIVQNASRLLALIRDEALLFVAKSYDRIELRSLHCRIYSEEQPNAA
jgi:hypothetical protein